MAFGEGFFLLCFSMFFSYRTFLILGYPELYCRKRWGWDVEEFLMNLSLGIEREYIGWTSEVSSVVEWENVIIILSVVSSSLLFVWIRSGPSLLWLKSWTHNKKKKAAMIMMMNKRETMQNYRYGGGRGREMGMWNDEDILSSRNKSERLIQRKTTSHTHNER